eukprot:jgi/Chlat1/1891/Chrsp145S02208
MRATVLGQAEAAGSSGKTVAEVEAELAEEVDEDLEKAEEEKEDEEDDGNCSNGFSVVAPSEADQERDVAHRAGPRGYSLGGGGGRAIRPLGGGGGQPGTPPRNVSRSVSSPIRPIAQQKAALAAAVAAGNTRAWLRVAADGSAKVLEAGRQAVMGRTGVAARDLRMLDPFLNYPSNILVRDRALVLNLEHVRAIITSEEMLLLAHTDPLVSPVASDLQRRLAIERVTLESKQQFSPVAPVPFEFRCLEVVLESVISLLENRAAELKKETYQAMEALTGKVTTANLERVRKAKSKMTRLTTRVQTVREELESILNDDEDMAAMYLTRKKFLTEQEAQHLAEELAREEEELEAKRRYYEENPDESPRSSASSSSRSEQLDVDDLEHLLEVYFMQIDGTHNTLLALKEYVDDTEDFINIQLDSHRNQLIQLEVILTAGSFAIAVPYIVFGIYGMNIPEPNGLWSKTDAFYPIVFCTIAVSCLFFVAFVVYCRWRRLMCF